MATEYSGEPGNDSGKGEAHRTNPDLTAQAEAEGFVARSLHIPGFIRPEYSEASAQAGAHQLDAHFGYAPRR